MKATGDLPTLLVIGPVPPPAFGVAKATRLLLDSPVLASRWRLVHLDTTDKRGIANMGRLDWGNISLGLKHLCMLVSILSRERPAITLLTVSQGRLALFRDLAFVVLARMFGSQVVAYLRGSRYAELRERQGLLAARALRAVLKLSARVIVLGTCLKQMALAVSRTANVAVVPNGCPPALPPEKTAVRDETAPLVLYMGRLSAAKGVDDLLVAASDVRQRVPTASFYLCGEWDSPEYRTRIQALVDSLGLCEAVRFPGSVDGTAKEDLLARAWVVVSASHSEGQPWLILEAMSAGVPVVATSTGAVSETILEGVSGYVVSSGDIRSLADRISLLLTDSALWQAMARASLARYEELFTLERAHGLLAIELDGVIGRV